MEFMKILSRISGFSTSVFGVSWNPSPREVDVARRVLAFLEDRRVLYNPYDIEVESQCVSSVVDIRKFLTDIIGQLNSDSKLGEHLRGIRAACRAFLDETSPGSRHIQTHHWHGPFESSFFTALGELRATIGMHIAGLAVMYGLDVEGELESILPAEALD